MSPTSNKVILSALPYALSFFNGYVQGLCSILANTLLQLDRYLMAQPLLPNLTCFAEGEKLWSLCHEKRLTLDLVPPPLSFLWFPNPLGHRTCDYYVILTSPNGFV